MKTVSILIGNSDDKLTQREWTNFIAQTSAIVGVWSTNVHFSGFSAPDRHWQNACYVFEIKESSIPIMKEQLAFCAQVHRQDSIALVIGETELIKPGGS